MTYRDENYAGRIGWKEILVGNARSSSDELRAYPKDLLSSPLAVTAVQTRLVPGTVPGTRPHVTHGTALQARDRIADSRFAALVGRDHLGAWVILASLGAALFWGMAHALSPGHGKTIVTAYLVGQRGTPRHAALLGVIVTVTHTIGVFTLGLITLLLSRFIVPDQLYPWLNLVSGLLVVAIGASVLRARWLHRRAHAHGHDHHHHHGHGEDLSLRSLLAVGVSGGLLPCPSALVVLLAAISLAPVGVRPAADRRVQRGPRIDDHRNRPCRRACPRRLQEAQLRGSSSLTPAGRERARHPRRWARNDDSLSARL